MDIAVYDRAQPGFAGLIIGLMGEGMIRATYPWDTGLYRHVHIFCYPIYLVSAYLRESDAFFQWLTDEITCNKCT